MHNFVKEPPSLKGVFAKEGIRLLTSKTIGLGLLLILLPSVAYKRKLLRTTRIEAFNQIKLIFHNIFVFVFKLIFRLSLNFSAGAGFSNIPDKYENVVFIIKILKREMNVFINIFRYIFIFYID